LVHEPAGTVDARSPVSGQPWLTLGSAGSPGVTLTSRATDPGLRACGRQRRRVGLASVRPGSVAIPDVADWVSCRSRAEVLLGSAPEYVAVSHAGHGANSYALNYHLVLGGLAVFVQAPWGGAYVDADRAAAEVRSRFEGLASLIDLAGSRTRTRDRTYPVLIVLDSRFRGIGLCAAVPAPIRRCPDGISLDQEAADVRGPARRGDRPVVVMAAGCRRASL
jgi:hypothetical protein